MRAFSLLRLVFALLLALSLAWGGLQGAGERVLVPGYHHLGNDATPEWTEASPEPQGTRYDLDFESGPNAGEWLLSLEARSINNDWWLELNGVRLALLRKGEELRRHEYPIPAGALLVGTNRLSVVPTVAEDDITFGNVRLMEQSLREYLGLVPLDLEVLDEDSGRGLPARVTIVDAQGALAECYFEPALETALRPGVLYTSDKRARLELRPGEYRIFATRGMEWGLAQATLNLREQAPSSVVLRLRREVDTPGFVAADTHIHTLTFSGHGDASIEERILTLAGEGVELAIATDHNHNTDYRPHQIALGMQPYYTPVVGNEVTTEVGHFNAFPLDPGAEIPDFKSTDYTTLVQGMRAKGAQVVILNHPRWPEHATGPFGVAGLNPFTGVRATGLACTFDATELVNSTTEESDPLFLFWDWFALLNRGEKVVAVGSSDSHTVGEPVGQGRTYVRSASTEPATIDVMEACRNIAQGRSSISQGIYAEATVEAGVGMGELAPVEAGQVALRLRVAAPSWIEPAQVRVYVNGQERWGSELVASPGPCDLLLEQNIAWPYPHDGWLVCVITGPGVDGPFWPLLNPYTLAATNPIYLDADGNGRYESPFATAQRLTQSAASVGDFATALAGCDVSVQLQGLDLARQAFELAAREQLTNCAQQLASDGRVQEWLATLPKLQ